MHSGFEVNLRRMVMYLDKEEILCSEVHGMYTLPPPDWP